MKTEKYIPENVDAYIADFPAERQERMQAIRKFIHDLVPGVQEKISWSMPTFCVGKQRVHFAGQKHHIGFYPGEEPIRVFQQEISPLKYTKGGIQLPDNKPIPFDLLEKIVLYAFEE